MRRTPSQPPAQPTFAGGPRSTAEIAVQVEPPALWGDAAEGGAPASGEGLVQDIDLDEQLWRAEEWAWQLQQRERAAVNIQRELAEQMDSLTQELHGLRMASVAPTAGAAAARFCSENVSLEQRHAGRAEILRREAKKRETPSRSHLPAKPAN